MNDLGYLASFFGVLFGILGAFFNLKNLPLVWKIILLVVLVGLFLPILGPAFMALRSGPITQEAIQLNTLSNWPIPVMATVLGAMVGLMFASTSTLVEPLVNQCFAWLPKFANHLSTGLLGGFLYSVILVTLLFCFSARVFTPLLSVTVILWLGAAIAGAQACARAIRFSLPLSTQREGTRVVLQPLMLFPAVVGVSLRLRQLDEQLWEWSFWLTVASVAASTATSILWLVMRPPMPPPPVVPPDLEDPERFRCPHCDADFATSRGVAVHRGKMHFQCDLCDFVSTSARGLAIHRGRMHGT